ncbi:MAG: DCC1-like thiol-disulfide oxidoreductase family protein [Verrucomicrobiia bacterium]
MREILPRFLLFFDGECGLCHRAVRFFLLQDKNRVFYFASLQGATAHQVRERHKNDWDEELKSMVLVEDYDTSQEKIYRKSQAVIRALGFLGGFWRMISGLLRMVPRWVADRVYDKIAKNRYNWFEVTSVCDRIVDGVLKERFLS